MVKRAKRTTLDIIWRLPQICSFWTNSALRPSAVKRRWAWMYDGLNIQGSPFVFCTLSCIYVLLYLSVYYIVHWISIQAPPLFSNMSKRANRKLKHMLRWKIQNEYLSLILDVWWLMMYQTPVRAHCLSLLRILPKQNTALIALRELHSYTL